MFNLQEAWQDNQFLLDKNPVNSLVFAEYPNKFYIH